MKNFYTLCFFSLFTIQLTYAQIYVDVDATGANNGSSWADAYSDLQDAIPDAVATPGADDIFIAEGTYYPTATTDRTISFEIPENTTVYGGFSPSNGAIDLATRDFRTYETTLDGDIGVVGVTSDNSNTIISLLSPDVEINGVTVTHVDSGGSGAISVGGLAHSNIVVINCIIRNNLSSGIIAAYNIHIKNSIFHDNDAGADMFSSGGAIFFLVQAGNTVIDNCLFYNNTANFYGGAIRFHVITSNPIFSISNSTFFNNTAVDFADAILAEDGDTMNITNSIFWDNDDGDGNDDEIATFGWTTLNYTHSLIKGTDLTGSNGLDGTNPANDPLFTNPAANDFTLQPTSPVIDLGDYTAVTLPTDLNGDTRILDGDGNGTATVDFGAYESPAVTNCTVFTTNIVYLDINAAGTNDGSSWANAFTDLQDALDAITDCPSLDTIWVAAGTYLPTEEPDGAPTGLGNERYKAFHHANKDLKMYGGFNGTETLLSQRDWLVNPTILSGDFNNDDVVTGGGATLSFANNGENAYHVFVTIGLTTGAELDGFSVLGSNADENTNFIYAGVTIFNSLGGGMYNSNSSPTLTNVTFSANNAIQGAGINNRFSSPSLTNVTFSANNAVVGGGLYNFSNSSPTLTNVTFSANNGTNSGGGMYNSSSSPSLTNVTFSANNTLNEGGGMFNASSSPSLTNVTFSANNATNYGGGMVNDNNSSPTLTNVTFSANSANIGGGGVANFNSSPNLTNTLFYENTAPNQKDILNNTFTPNVSFSAFEDYDISGCASCITLTISPFVNAADPDGVDNILMTADDGLTLAAGSPPVGAGTSTGAPTTDITGATRPIPPSMGTYERNPTDCLVFIANIIYVNINATGANNGSSWADAFTDLQDAITAINDCPGLDTIYIAEGTYLPTTTTDRTISFEIPGNTTVYGGFSPSNGVIDLGTRNFTTYPSILRGDIGVPATATDNTAHVIRLFDASGPIILDGITVSNGYTDVFAMGPRGGGIDIQGNAVQLTLRNCIVSNNYAAFDGGGINIIGNNCFLTIENSEILNNNATGAGNSGGGGISTFTSNNTIDITNTTIANNSSGIGGGLHIRFGTLSIENTIIEGNSGQAGGGGIFSDNAIATTITNSIFRNNTATSSNGGGGLLLDNINTVNFENLLFHHNVSNNGGAIDILVRTTETINFSGCTFSENSSSGSGDVIRVRNILGSTATLNIINSILWDNDDADGLANEIVFTDPANGVENYSYSLLKGFDLTGSNGLDGTNPANDPLFTNPAANDFTLQPASPVIDLGDNSVVTVATDLNGDTRMLDGDGDTTATVDFGAYEAPEVVLTDCTVFTTNIVYVDLNAGGTNDGSSWANAFINFQDALDAITDCPSLDTIWVAAGTYLPTEEPDGAPTGPGNERYKAFHHANKDLKMYGGFNGTETLLSQRDWVNNPTILSGDFNNDDVVTGGGATLSFTNNGENAFHVFVTIGLSTASELDGFSILGAYANNSTNTHDYEGVTLNIGYGGGMFNSNSSPSITNVTITTNYAVLGGGMYNSNNSSPILTNVTISLNYGGTGGGMFSDALSSPAITNVTFLANNAFFNGGGIFSSTIFLTNVTFLANNTIGAGGGIYMLDSPNATLTNVTFLANTTSNLGGGIYIFSSSPTLTNVTFTANHANTTGGGIRNSNSSPVLTNTLFYGNTSTSGEKDMADQSSTPIVTYSAFEDYDISGCATCITLTADPFVNAADPDGADDVFMTLDDGLTLASGSPAAGAGTSTGAPLTDIAGSTRTSPPSMGAYVAEVLPNILVNSTTGDLEFIDHNDRDDNLTLVIDVANYRFTDPINALIAGPGALQIDPNTVEVPIASVTGMIAIATVGGDDAFTTDFSGGNFIDIINYDGGNQNATGDILRLQAGGTFVSVEHTFISESDGTVSVFGNNLISYIGLEPILDNLSVTDRVFTFTGADETITLSDDGDAGDNESFIDSTLGESVTYINPTNSLTVNTEISGGSGTDTINIEGVDAAFDANLTVNAGADDVADFQTNPTHIGTGTYDVNAAYILSQANISTSGSGAIVFNATDYLEVSTNAIITSENGDINLNSNSAETATANQIALSISGNSEVRTTGSGTINLNGVSKGSIGVNFNPGVAIGPNAILENTGTGNINITGTGGVGDDLNVGVNIQAAVIIRTIDGGITINGTSGMGTGNNNYGINLYQGSLVEATGPAGTITLDGTSTSGVDNNHGINIANAGTQIRAAGGAINITGQGTIGATGNNSGIQISDGVTMDNIDAGVINITGVGGDGISNNNGVNVGGAGTAIRTIDGEVTINGTSGVGTYFYNYGIRVESGAVVESIGTGSISMDGTTTEGYAFGTGIIITDTSTEIRTNGGGINLTGQGALTSTLGRNYGVSTENEALVIDSSGGDIIVNGTGGDGDLVNIGVTLRSGSTMSVTNGTLDINAIGGGVSTGNSNHGFVINGDSKAEATGSGSIIINGQATMGTDACVGVLLAGSNTEIVSAGGGISVTGQSAGTDESNFGLYMDAGAAISDTAGGDITINATGANGTGPFNAGIWIQGSSSFNTTGTGNINATGTAGNAISSAIVLLNLDARIFAGATATITAVAGPLTTPAGIPPASLIEGTTVILNGEMQPGDSPTAGPGQLPITANTALSTGDELTIDIDGFTTAGIDYDQLKVTGTVDVTDATLTLVDTTTDTGVVCTDEIIIIDNDGADAIIGTFAGLPEGTDIAFNAELWRISYLGGDGNDVTLTLNPEMIASPICMDITVQLDGTGNATIIAGDIDGGTPMGCPFDSLSIDITDFDCSNMGLNNVVLTITDIFGNTADCTAIVTIEDVTAPTITCPGDQIEDLDANCEFILPDYTVLATVVDVCDGAPVLTQTPIAGTVITATTQITLFAEDASGNINSCVFDVIPVDVTPPTITCPGDQTEAADASCMLVLQDYTSLAIAVDNCGSISIIQTPAPGTLVGLGTTIITLEASDGSNSSNCIFNVTVEDTTPPMAVCQDFTAQLDASGISVITPADVDGGSTDNCSIASMSVSPNTFSCADVGLQTVTLIVTDIAGNMSTCDATVTIEDNIIPTAICQDISVTLEAGNTVTILPSDLDGGSSDNCSIDSISASQTTFTCDDIGMNSVTVTITDVNGNISTCSAIVTVIEDVPPIAVCQPFTAQLDAFGIVTILPGDVDGGSTDNCAIDTITLSQDIFDCDDVGENTITMTVTDVSGNSATCTTIVTVEENVAPDAICQDITIQLDATGTTTIIADDVNGGSSDACGIDSIGIDIETFDCSNVGPNNVTLTVTDVNGNVNTCIAIVTVEEENAVPISLCQNITVPLQLDGTAVIEASAIDAGSTGGGCVNGITIDIDTFDCSDVGTPVEVTLSVTNGNGDVDTCTALVNVIDTLDPEITCPEDQTVTTNGTTYELPDYVALGAVFAEDNCFDITSIVQDPPAETLLDIGLYIINFEATDPSGNSASCNFRLTVDSVLGIPAQPDLTTLSMFPNPAKNYVMISNPYTISLKKIQLYDITGRLVKMFSVNNTTEQRLDISEIASATYILLINTEAGQVVKQLVKE